MPSLAVDGDRGARLARVCHELLGGRRLIVASNRGPVEYTFTPTGTLSAQRAHGGPVSGMATVGRYCGLVWVANAMGEADRRASQATPDGLLCTPLPGQNLSVRFVVTGRGAYHKFYNVISNPLLWFLQHSMWNPPYTPNIDANSYEAWDSGYVAVNRAFADAIISELGRAGTAPVAMIHDYQLYLVGGMVRAAVPHALLQHFVHVAWPAAGTWMLLPQAMRGAILDSLCANDVVGFQTTSSARDFLRCVETYLPGATVDFAESAVKMHDHITRVAVYPASIDTVGVRRTASSSRVREYQEVIQRDCAPHTIVRVDRLDPSRNIMRGFRAYESLLERLPSLQGDVKFLAFLTPSRTRVREYQRYRDDLTALVSRINLRFGRPDWQPITLYLENNYLQALAALRLYDVLLVNPVVDGMNLAAKEGPIVNTRDGALVISEGSGACEQLREGALVVAPTDLESTMNALFLGLTMGAEERHARADWLRQQIEADDVTDWLYRQLADLAAVARDHRILLPLPSLGDETTVSA